MTALIALWCILALVAVFLIVAGTLWEKNSLAALGWALVAILVVTGVSVVVQEVTK